MVVLATKIGELASKYLGDEEVTNSIVMDIWNIYHKSGKEWEI